jgi:hypothetical protein
VTLREGTTTAVVVAEGEGVEADGSSSSRPSRSSEWSWNLKWESSTEINIIQCICILLSNFRRKYIENSKQMYKLDWQIPVMEIK